MASKLAQPETQLDVIRIVLVGKTGVGKSATANTILGREAFESELSPSSVTSQCKKVGGKVGMQEVAVVDTPGVFDTFNEDEALTEIQKCICFSAPGPHVFLVVIQLGRFTPEEQQTLKIIQNTFGVEADNYIIVLLTHGDRLKGKSIEDFLNKSPPLQGFIQKCKGGYHLFNNEDKSPLQVIELLEKIQKMVSGNGGSHYTNKMFKEAERAIQKEKEKILRENKEQRNRAIEKLRNHFQGVILQQHIHELQQQHESEARSTAEKTNEFVKKGSIAFGAVFGGILGIVGGPVGVIAGAGIGAAVGSAAADLSIHLTKKLRSSGCLTS